MTIDTYGQWAKRHGAIFRTPGGIFTASEFRDWIRKCHHDPGARAPNEDELYEFAHTPLAYALNVAITYPLEQLSDGAGQLWREVKPQYDDAQARYNVLLRCIAYEVTDKIVSSLDIPDDYELSTDDRDVFVESCMVNMKRRAERGKSEFHALLKEQGASAHIRRRARQHFKRMLNERQQRSA